MMTEINEKFSVRRGSSFADWLLTIGLWSALFALAWLVIGSGWMAGIFWLLVFYFGHGISLLWNNSTQVTIGKEMLFGDSFVFFSPGRIHVKPPWVSIDDENRGISFERKDVPISCTVFSSDGAGFEVSGTCSMILSEDPQRVVQFIHSDMDPTVIAGTIQSAIQGLAAAQVGNKQSGEVMPQSAEISERINTIFKVDKAEEMERSFGVEISLVRLNFKPTKETAETLGARFAFTVQKEQVEAMGEQDRHVLELAAVNLGKKIDYKVIYVGGDMSKEGKEAMALAEGGAKPMINVGGGKKGGK